MRHTPSQYHSIRSNHSAIMPRLVVFLLLWHFTITTIYAAISVEQMTETVGTFRTMCQPKFKITDENVEGLRKKIYPDDKELKCYVNCVFELMRVSKKGKLLYDSSLKQINTMLPEDMRDTYTTALNTCKDSGKGIKDNCESAYAMIQCFFENNPMFIFPS